MSEDACLQRNSIQANVLIVCAGHTAYTRSVARIRRQGFRRFTESEGLNGSVKGLVFEAAENLVILKKLQLFMFLDRRNRDIRKTKKPWPWKGCSSRS
jgi:hypothetical protein